MPGDPQKPHEFVSLSVFSGASARPTGERQELPRPASQAVRDGGGLLKFLSKFSLAVTSRAGLATNWKTSHRRRAEEGRNRGMFKGDMTGRNRG